MTTFNYIALGIMFAWAIEALLCALQVKRFSREVAMPRRKKHEQYTPFAAVIVPFKGIDEDMPQAVASLCTQAYPDYRLIFVVDSETDAALPVLRSEAAKHPHRRVEILISGIAPPTVGQKVHNQLFAIETLSDEDVVWVFADSDAVPGSDWLAKMVNPLMKPNTGMTTGYRWLVPAPGGDSLAAKLASIINSSVACGYRSRGLSQAWGGAMALRGQTARSGNLPGYLRGALTDDYQFTRMCNDIDLRVYFVPQTIAATPVDFDWPGFLNFAHRQYLITRIYAPRLFFAGLAVTGFYVLGLAVTLYSLVEGLFFHDLAKRYWLVPLIVLVTVGAANQVRATFRARVIREALGDEMLKRLRPTLRLDRFATSMWMTLHFLLIVGACFGRVMKWRGIRYRPDGPQRISKLD